MSFLSLRSLAWCLSLCAAALLFTANPTGAQMGSGVGVSGNVSQFSAAQPAAKVPPNTVTYTCPSQVKGAACETFWTDRHGPVTATFNYISKKGSDQSRVFDLYCEASKCQTEAYAKGANMTPETWVFTGHDVALVPAS
jgi:hypothetical protein